MSKPQPDPAPAGPQAQATPWDELDLAASSLSLQDFPSFRITRLATLLQRSLTRQYLEQYGVTVPEWRTLCALAQFSPMPVGALLKLSGYDKALVSRALHAMSEKGLVEISPDPGHGRRLDAQVTEDGRSLYERILPDARRRQSQLLGLLTLEERRGLYRALVKLQSAFDEPGGPVSRSRPAAPGPEN